MLLHKVGLSFSRAAGIRYFSPNGGDTLVPLRAMVDDHKVLENQGCFCPIRIPIDIPNSDEGRILLHLRDPRDALVSMYYSYCFSHPGEIAGGTGYRREIANRGIDDFVIRLATSSECPVRGDYGTGSHLWDIAGNYANRYTKYVRNFVGKPGVVLIRYEDMTDDFVGWLTIIANSFGLTPQHPIFSKIIAAEAPEAEINIENKWSHKRKITPGDHLEKLHPDTVLKLNEVFKECLESLGYT
jgi:hypothetical protein